MTWIKAYGFGSYFTRNGPYTDIDILLIHASHDAMSISSVIKCKKELLKKIPQIDVTILSDKEERGLCFLKKSNAQYLGEISLISIKDIIKTINNYKHEKCE